MIATLREYVSGRMPTPQFLRIVNETLLAGAQTILYPGAEPDAVWSIDLVCAEYLDFANDESLAGDGGELRRLARSMLAILEQVPREEDRRALLSLARSAPQTVGRVTAYLAGHLKREALEVFLARRAWPQQLTARVRGLEDAKLGMLAQCLEAEEYAQVLDILRGS